MLHIYLLGDFQIFWGKEEIPLTQRRLQSLLAYLLLHRRVAETRQRLVFLRWPDIGESKARAYLRRDLHDLQSALPEPNRFLQVTRHTLGWRADAPFTLDIDDFSAALAKADHALEQGDRGGATASLQEAVALFKGSLWPGGYEEWIEPERTRLDVCFGNALQ